MPNQDYQWKRFWCPRSGRINLADGGYLCDPEEKWGKIYNPDLVTFDAISDFPCLALLGEPGIGKSRALEAQKKEIISKIQQQGGQVHPLDDIRSFGNESRLVDKLFNSPQFNEWLQGTHQLHIFLDSFDECRLHIKTLATLLVDEFKAYRAHIKRLHLRIACRTAVWQPVLEEGLKQIWGKDSVGIYELAPLRRVDVSKAAKIEGINNPEAFIEEINRKNVVPLAIKPITLEFLIKTYRSYNGKFPPNQRLHELYLEGCLWLCEERNKSRISSELKGNLKRQQRLMVAARIAAIMIFGKKSVIWTGIPSDVPDDDVFMEKICQGTESVYGREFEITEEAVKEVLDTGLFSSRGELSRMGWAHQTYAEFLAAWYLTQRHIELSQILKLIVHSDDPDGKIIPQLYETVAWIASMLPEVFQEVMKTDPHILLQSDVATVSDNDKASLVESLLKLHNEEKLTYQHNTWLYKNLNYPKLPDQLQPYICDSTKSINARNVAIDIAEACNVKAVQEYLADVALDPQQHSWVRINAAVAVCNLGDDKTKARLKPLAVAKIQNDVEEQLKGCGLRAVWPGNITAEEVFNVITQPVSKSSGGRYQDFIAKELGEHLQISDLPVALRWLEKQVNRRDLHYPFGQLSDEIMLKGWDNLNEPEVMQAFTRVAFLRLQNHDVIIYDDSYKTISFSQVLKDDVHKRRQLVESIISIIPESDKEPLWLISHRTRIVFKQDFTWLIKCLQNSTTEHHQRIFAKLICWNFRLAELEFEYLDAVLTESQTNLILRKEFESLIEVRAQQEQARYLEQQEGLEEDEKQSLLEPPPKERVLKILSQIEADQSNFWCSLCFELTLEADSTHYGDPFRSSLTNLPGWIEAEDSTKEKILSAARLYLSYGDPENQAWLGTNNFRYSALLGYQALSLLLQKAPNFIFTLSAEEWQKWTAIILLYPNWGRTEDQEHRQILINKAYANAPSEFIKILIILIEKQNREHGFVEINRFIKNCWDENLARAIFEKVQDKELTDKSLGDLLDNLLKYGFIEAKAFAESLITSPLPSSGEKRAKALVAACALILYTEDAGWSVVWPVIQQDVEFGREVVEYSGSIEQRLPEQHIADLYILLAKQYLDSDENKQNISQDEKRTGLEEYSLTKTWKNYIPQHLQERGTPQACEALRKIILELPQLKDKLQWRLLEAETLARRQSWQPLKPEQILQIVSNKPKNQSTQIQARVVIMQGSNNPNLNFSGSVGAVNLNSTVNGDQIGTQHNYAQEQNLTEAFEEIQQIVNRITQNYPTQTEAEKQIIIAEAVEQVKQNPTLRKRLELGGKAFIFEGLQKVSDQWWVAPFVKAIEAAVKGE